MSWINIPEGVFWISWGEIYINGNEITWQCSKVYEYDGGMSILNITQNTDWYRVKCGHIIDWTICSYLSHITWEEKECPLTQNKEIEIIPQQKTQAA